MFSLDGLRVSGFTGFRRLLTLDTASVPTDGGVYVVLADPAVVSRFLPVSVGGHHKGKDPTVENSVLHSNWVDNCTIVYIGKANRLQSRLRQYRNFGQGKPVPHWGGRLIWQLENHADLIVCWRTTTEEPRQVEESMLAAFEIHYGRLPFANLSH